MPMGSFRVRLRAFEIKASLCLVGFLLICHHSVSIETKKRLHVGDLFSVFLHSAWLTSWNGRPSRPRPVGLRWHRRSVTQGLSNEAT